MIVQTNDKQELVVDAKAYILLEELGSGYKYECVYIDASMSAEALEIKLVKAIREIADVVNIEARLTEVYKYCDKARWQEELKLEWMESYPDTREMTEEERLVHDTVVTTEEVTVQEDTGEVDEDGNQILADVVQTNEVIIVIEREEWYVYPTVQIERKITLTEYMNDKVYEELDVTDKVEATTWLGTYRANKAKEDKARRLDSIVVTVGGNVFDGNEKARLNMLSAIQAASITGLESTYWKMADNSVVEVTVDELKEALTKAIQEVGRVIV